MQELNRYSNINALVNHYRSLIITTAIIPANGSSPECAIQSSDGNKTYDVPDADSVTLSSSPVPVAYLLVQALASISPALVWHVHGLLRFQVVFWLS